MSVEVEMPESTKEAVSMFGEEVVLSYFNADMTVAMQSALRGKMTVTEDGEKSATGIKAKDLQTFANEWKPGKKQRGRPAEERLADDIQKLTPEQKAALLKSLGVK
jgi:hypothetical protein